MSSELIETSVSEKRLNQSAVGLDLGAVLLDPKGIFGAELSNFHSDGNAVAGAH